MTGERTRAVARIEAGAWDRPADDQVLLDYEGRFRRRILLKSVEGLAFLLDLPKAEELRGGDALALDDGRLVEVVAADEPIAEISGRDAEHVTKLAWHLGNRHHPAEIHGAVIRVRRDHVIEAMLQGLGAEIRHLEAPFQPERGAYAHGHDHGPAPASGGQA